MDDVIRVLSLGAGVQSSTVLLMSVRGELPPLDAAIFSDTQWEPPAVYRHLDWLAKQAQTAGIAVHRVSAGNLRSDALRSEVRNSTRWASMPLYTFPPTGRRLADGTADPRDVGMIRRQCTKEYKIVPVRQAIRRHVLGVSPRARVRAGAVELWMGISEDEITRMSRSSVQYIVHRHPLIEWVKGPRRRLFPSGYNREDCLTWLHRHGYPEPPRSACIGCPFHSDEEWLAIKTDPEAWADACAFDAAIRRRDGHRGELYLHEACVPLDEVSLDHGSRSRRGGPGGFQQECVGVCGV
ncbi:MAG: hypothetical protein ACLFV3_12155 [Phycisphaeraceae bacterium]